MVNEYEIRGEVTAIFLKRKNGEILETVIDTKDLERAMEHTGIWSAWFERKTGTYYVRGSERICSGKYRTLHLHRWLFEDTKLLIDHRNHDTLDNRRSENLREVTPRQNQQNRNGAQSNSASGIRGVNWHKQRNKWRAAINRNGIDLHIGYYTELIDAEKAVIEARIKFMPHSQEALSS